MKKEDYKWMISKEINEKKEHFLIYSLSSQENLLNNLISFNSQLWSKNHLISFNTTGINIIRTRAR